MMQYVMTKMTEDKLEESIRASKRQRLGASESELFKNSIMIPAKLCDYLLLERGQLTPSPYIEKMIGDFRNRGVHDEDVLDVFRRVDRQLFLVSSMNVHKVRDG